MGNPPPVLRYGLTALGSGIMSAFTRKEQNGSAPDECSYSASGLKLPTHLEEIPQAASSRHFGDGTLRHTGRIALFRNKVANVAATMKNCDSRLKCPKDPENQKPVK
jgi:hypothetical protein